MHRMLHGGGAVRTPCEQPTIRGILRVTDLSVVDLVLPACTQIDWLLAITCTRPSRCCIICYCLWVTHHREPQYQRRKPWPLNALEPRGNYSATATSNNMKLVYWPLTGWLLHLVQRGGDWAGPQPAQAPLRCTKCNSPPINGQRTNHCIAL